MKHRGTTSFFCSFCSFFLSSFFFFCATGKLIEVNVALVYPPTHCIVGFTHVSVVLRRDR